MISRVRGSWSRTWGMGYIVSYSPMLRKNKTSNNLCSSMVLTREICAHNLEATSQYGADKMNPLVV